MKVMAEFHNTPLLKQIRQMKCFPMADNLNLQNTAQMAIHIRLKYT